MRLIDADALIKALEAIQYNDIYDLSLTEDLIDNAPTVDTTCPHCDSGYAQGLSDGYLKGKEDVIHDIAKQYSAHNELVPIWLSIGGLKGGIECSQTEK